MMIIIIVGHGMTWHGMMMTVMMGYACRTHQHTGHASIATEPNSTAQYAEIA